MKLTKKEKLEAYKWLLVDLKICQEANAMFFICIALCDWCVKALKQYPDIHDIPKIFDELKAFKPKKLHKSGGWFDGKDYRSRLDLLNNIIDKF